MFQTRKSSLAKRLFIFYHLFSLTNTTPKAVPCLGLEQERQIDKQNKKQFSSSKITAERSTEWFMAKQSYSTI